MTMLVRIAALEIAPWAVIAFTLGLVPPLAEIGGGEDFLKAGIPIGMGFGLWLGLRDQVLGTEDYELHRHASAARQASAVWLAFLAVGTFWFLWPPLVWQHVLGRTVHGAPASTWIPVQISLLGGFGFGAWTARLPTTNRGRAVVAALGLLLSAYATERLEVERVATGRLAIVEHPWLVALASLAVFALALVRVARLAGRPYDRDRPAVGLPESLLVVALGATVLESPLIAGGALGSPLLGPGSAVRWAVGALLAAHAAVVLRRAGARDARCWLWAVAILATGAAGALARALLDPARAHRSVASAAAPPAALLHSPSPRGDRVQPC